MITIKKHVFGILFSSSLLVACGGNNDNEEELLSGVFSDSPVGGLNFTTQTTRGLTDVDGVFQYREGETVVFRIGRLALPPVVAAPLVTPLDMAAEGGIDDPSVVNIARLLQSLDEDADPENGIVIPEATSDILVNATIFDATDDSAPESVVRQVYGDDRTAVSAEQAVAHFVDTLSTNAQSDGTLEQLSYIVGVDENFDGESLFIDQDTFSITLDGEVHTGVASVNEGVYQLSGTQDTWFVSVNDTEDAKLACIESVPTAIVDCESGLYQVFTEEAQALAFNAPDIDQVDVPAELEVGAATDAAESPEVIEQPVDSLTDELTLPEPFPPCLDGTIDDDGDGFGWQNNQSCLIAVDGEVVAESDRDIAPSAGEAESPAETTTIVAEAPASETDEELVQVEENNIIVPVAAQPSDITDIIVLTGQANAAGVQTEFDATLDAGDENLFAFNEDGQWQVADLNQFWDENIPSNFASAEQGREPYNNIAFQIGKSLTEQTDRVVGIILVTAPGEGISHWDFNSEFYRKIRNKVADALATLPQKNSVDAVVWMQGETDWLAQGTADLGATGFTSTDSDFYRDYYPNKLNQLVSNLRSEWWHAFDAQFICAETKKADLNQHLLALNNDGDNRTSCAQASDLPTRDNDPFGNHFSAASLRTLGDRIAALYLSGG